MWFKNAQNANMRILTIRWRLKLAEYNYDVVYKAGKIKVNADALSRNPVDLRETECKPIRKYHRLNSTNRKNTKTFANQTEEQNQEEEECNFKLRLSDDEADEDYKEQWVKRADFGPS